jgi:hypothetical protein
MVSHNDRTIGLEGHLVFGGSANLAINHVEQELEESEVTGEGSPYDVFGEPLGVTFAVRSIEPTSKSESRQATVGRGHEVLPVLS